MSYFLVFLLHFSFSSFSSQFSCKDIFVDQTWLSSIHQLEILNSSELLSDMVLVQNTEMTTALRQRSISQVFALTTKAKLQGTKSVFFDDISLAIALKENFIAQFLYHSSQYNYKNVQLGQDLLLVAIFFNNTKMFDFFVNQGIVLSISRQKKVLAWALEANRPDVHWAMTRRSR